MAAREFEVDVPALIGLVEANPVIWDRAEQGYKTKDVVKETWWTIGSQLDDAFHDRTPAEQDHIILMARKKWVNLRDCWMKNYRLSQKCKVKKRKYIYYNQLEFLLKVANCNGDDERQADQSREADDSEEVAQKKICRPVAAVPEVTTRRATSFKKSSEDLDFRVSVAVDGEREKKVEDPRLLFFKGILPSIEHFSNDQFIDFQIKVLQMIKTINAGARE